MYKELQITEVEQDDGIGRLTIYAYDARARKILAKAGPDVKKLIERLSGEEPKSAVRRRPK